MTQPSRSNRLGNADQPQQRVLFLGYNQKQTRAINTLSELGCLVHHTEDPIDGQGNYDLVVSFGYRHIVQKEVIDALDCPIFNLHISYLPYNRGAHPNFWSFYENTPSGVTIHLIDDGIDTGPIAYQRYVNFNESEITFAQTHARLIAEIENLFSDKAEQILDGRYIAKVQRGVGTLHYSKDLPSSFAGWNSVITDELQRLDSIGFRHE